MEPEDHKLRNLYLLAGNDRQAVRRRAERARAGRREVHVLLDWVGSGKIDSAYLKEMEEAGIEVKRYNRPHWQYTFGRLNNRTHRKPLVVDGRIGFTGGVGIADLWSGNAQDRDHWRDTHYRIEGPAVAQMQSAFHDNWVEVTGRLLHGPDYYRRLTSAGPHYAQVFTSSPGGGGESMQLMYLLSIAAAAKNIRLSASYFVPDELSVETFIPALKRGVKIQIILPGPVVDTDVVRRASRAAWDRSCVPARKSTSTSRRCSTARSWWWTSGRRSARPISTIGPSASTTRPT